ncbi:hypothetical protein D9V41_13250 [Aeromicrobium phragmitis]|uniref:Acyltransferase n=1 Tax=Aeromicrobium phragmitis TaxID=2478914 RepID=A0A3L8PI97_9ACTN|nr:hypothetical protein [Aeromicrobium phragmitis]RLV55055.1 hypothetical protein D9V41_13250 [Aeromicrobium phragmitis]
MEWNRGASLTPEHRDRFRAAGVDAGRLDTLDWRQAEGDWPSWWSDLGNALYVAPGARLPDAVVAQLVTFPFRDALLAIGGPMDHVTSLLLGGDGATVFIDEGCVLTAGEVYCGADSQVVLHGPLLATRCAVVDARNGGSVVVDGDQLWAANVYVATDDMHRLEDLHTGERINPYGASIRIRRHVWLCRDAVVTGHVEIGEGACVGMRSIVRGQKVPAHSVVAGAPARVVRESVTWDYPDRP